MDNLSALVTHYIDVWGYWAIFIGMALESANIPIPSELIFGFAGYLVYLGKLNFWLATTYGVLGGLLGSIVSYAIGYYGGRPFVFQYGKYFFVTRNKIDLAQRWFDRYGLTAVFIARLLPVIRTFISLPAGFARVDFTKFVVYTILGSIPWTIALTYLGQLLGENWHLLSEYGHQISIFVIVIIFIVIMAILWKRISAQGAK
ncbi:MAG TPA: DedA family protein [Methylomusa anaerophila]|uniref:Inner membrane protein YabI n=1 Tax=Methylomusa anaerophila TaxID=1930071 RepID=A0A348AJF1_9FIRM|nr:DedA family protein [Methylomusa anaerophila]BBB91199.1 inner membrane protein YabI [Methylomusa anaerophila]HML89806.1 DedA family protein [Methylomusa anaerophila]